MATALYKIDKTTGEVYAIFVSGINPNVKGYIVQRFTCTHGSWDAYWNNGAVTYPEGDWRHGRVDRMSIEYNVKENLWDFERIILNRLRGSNA